MSRKLETTETTYTVYRQWGWGATVKKNWRPDFEKIATLALANRFIAMSIESGWPKKRHRLVKVTTTTCPIPI